MDTVYLCFVFSYYFFNHVRRQLKDLINETNRKCFLNRSGYYHPFKQTQHSWMETSIKSDGGGMEKMNHLWAAIIKEPTCIVFQNHGEAIILSSNYWPLRFCMCLSCIKPLKGAKPVPGPTMMTGVTDLKGRRNWVLRTKIGMRETSPSVKTNITKNCAWDIGQ